MKLEHLIILQNKVDLIKEAQALEHQKSIAAFVKGTHMRTSHRLLRLTPVPSAAAAALSPTRPRLHF